jgi:hypothetical protein
MQTSLLPRYEEINPTAFDSALRVIVAAISFHFEIQLRNRSSTNQGALRRERGKRTAHSKPAAASSPTTRISIFLNLAHPLWPSPTSTNRAANSPYKSTRLLAKVVPEDWIDVYRILACGNIYLCVLIRIAGRCGAFAPL